MLLKSLAPYSIWWQLQETATTSQQMMQVHLYTLRIMPSTDHWNGSNSSWGRHDTHQPLHEGIASVRWIYTHCRLRIQTQNNTAISHIVTAGWRNCSPSDRGKVIPVWQHCRLDIVESVNQLVQQGLCHHTEADSIVMPFWKMSVLTGWRWVEIQRTIEFHLANALLCCRFTCPQLVKIKTPSFKIK